MMWYFIVVIQMEVASTKSFLTMCIINPSLEYNLRFGKDADKLGKDSEK